MTDIVAWGRRLSWVEVFGRDRVLIYRAPPEARVLIARHLDLEALDSLEAELHIQPWLDGIEARGRVSGVAQRLCGLTLEPFEEAVTEDLVWRVVPEGSKNAAGPEGGEIVIDLDADDPPDEATGGEIDPTSVVVEIFALALAPFPRKPGAAFVTPPARESLSPFAVLASLPPRSRDQ